MDNSAFDIILRSNGSSIYWFYYELLKIALPLKRLSVKVS